MKSPRWKRASALVIVLSIVVLMTLLVVGLTVAMRMERSASHYHLERARADLMARVGVDYGQALLRGATETPGTYWVSGPGRIVKFSQDGAPETVWLSSGFTNGSGYLTDSNSMKGVDLNRPGLDDTNDRILDPRSTGDGGLGAFRMSWIYVQKDGSYRTESDTNSIGRFAFWMDDESSRVNLNTAWARRTNVTVQGVPSQISLGGLPYGMAAASNAVFTEATNNSFNRPFTTPYDIMGREGTKGFSNTFYSNRFFLTHYTHDPNINPWGEPKINLTTRKINAQASTEFLDIVTDSSATPERYSGYYTNVSPAKLKTVHARILSYLQRKDWPYAPKGSFETKYGSRETARLAFDIIEYVRVGDMPTQQGGNVIVQPLVVSNLASMDLLPAETLIDSIPAEAAIGTTRRPMLTQVGIYCSANTTTNAPGGYSGELFGELYIPPGYKLTGSRKAILQAAVKDSGTGQTFLTNLYRTIPFSSTYTNFSISNIVIPAAGTNPPASVGVRIALLSTTNATTDPIRSTNLVVSDILEIAPLSSSDVIVCPVAPGKTGFATMNDPRLNKQGANWSQAEPPLSGRVAMANHPHAPAFEAFSGIPRADGAGATNSVAFSPTATYGLGVQTLGELGNISTGIDSVPPAPWRSLRFRLGSSPSADVVPDWALMDLFTVFVGAKGAELDRYLPGTNISAGRLNLNALIRDNTNASRTNALRALLTNTWLQTNANLDRVLTNIIQVKIDAQGKDFGQAAENQTLVSVGQLAEIEGITSVDDERSEQVLRDVASLATVRGNVFSIYSVGQALQMTANDKANVTGEKIVRVMVERYYDGNGQVKFRVISANDVFP